MSEQVIRAFLTGFGIGASSYLSFLIGSAIARCWARKDLSRDAVPLGHNVNSGSDFGRSPGRYVSNGSEHRFVKFFFRCKLLIQKVFLKAASDERSNNGSDNRSGEARN